MNKFFKSGNTIIMKKYLINTFVLCGCVGWCLECFWTGLHSVLKHDDLRFLCTTSIWMFPIYGMASLIAPISKKIKNYNFILRGTIYTLCIFTTEFLSGKWLKKRNACPWDYSNSKYHYQGVIRLDYAPVWFITGLLYEGVLQNK